MADEIRVVPVADRVEEILLGRARSGAGAALGADVLTIGQLERRLLDAAGLDPVPALTARLVAAGVAPGAAKGTTFETVAAEPGFAPAFLAVHDELRESGLGARALFELATRTGGLTRKRIEAVAAVALAYDAALERAGLHDRGSARAALPERIAAGHLPAELKGVRLAIEDVLELPTVRCRVLAALAAAGVEVEVALPDLDSRPGLAPTLEPLHRALELDAPGVKVTARSAAAAGALQRFQRRLFDPTLPAATGSPVEAIEGEDEAAELRAVVRTVRARLAAGVPADDVVIAARGLHLVRRRLVEALDQAGVPWRERRGTPVADAPPAALALQLVAAAERRLPRDDLARVITSAYVDAGAEGSPEESYLPARRIAELLRDAASRDDAGDGHAVRLKEYAKRLARAPGDNAAAKARDAVRAAARLEQLLPLLRLPLRAPLPHLGATLAGALSALGVPRRCRALEEQGHPAVDAAAARALARDRAALDAVFEACRAIGAAAMQSGLSQPVSLSTFRELLEGELYAATVRQRGARGGAVRLLDVSELAGRSIPHLVLIGLYDGGFPRRRAPQPLLDARDREALGRAAGRPVLRPGGTEEPLLFALACLAAERSLLLTTSRTDGSGGERPRSPFLTEALVAAGLDAPRCEPAAVVPPLLAAAGPREAMARLALLAAGARAAPGEPRPPAFAAIADAVRRARTGYPGSGARPSAETITLLSPAALAAVSADLARAALPFGDDVAWITSVSALEDYASCPFKFLGRRVLGLPEPMQLDDDLDLREGGSLLHELAAAVFGALKDAGLVPLAGSDRAPEEQRVAREACEAALTAWESRERTGPAALWSVRRELALDAVLRLVETETREAAGVVPVALEAGFGYGEEPPLYLPSPDGPGRIAVRGRVDRVDAGPGGIVVIDYKTGRVEQKLRGEEQGRTRFQLPIYAAWARRRYGGNVDAFYRSLQHGTFSRRLSQIGPDQLDLEALLELDPERRRAGRAGLPDDVDPNLADAAWSFLDSIRAGRFPVAPSDPAEDCQWCAFATVCRIDRHGTEP